VYNIAEIMDGNLSKFVDRLIEADIESKLRINNI
jgi:hypothetical protein